MTLKDELWYYLGFNKLPTEADKLEQLANELGIVQFNMWVEKHGRTGYDTYEAQKRIREELRFRWGGKVSILGALISVVAAIASWFAVFVD